MTTDEKLTKDITELKDCFFASCPRGLESMVVDELKDLGVKTIKPTTGGVKFETETLTTLEFIMMSRYASRVYKELYTFAIEKEKDLYNIASDIDWTKVFDLDQTFNIHCVLGQSSLKKKSHFTNTMFMSLTLKDAIVDRFRKEKNDRPNIEKQEGDVSFYLYISPEEKEETTKEDVTISMDMVGRPLHQRGYRKKAFSAPLKENLAAALCNKMLEDAKNGFWDVMCGSGTMAIEMAYLMSGMPPSAPLFYQEIEWWAFEKHLYLTSDPKMVKGFEDLLEKINKKIDEAEVKLKELPPIMSSDNDTRSLQFANECFELAGLTDVLLIKKEDAICIEPEFEGGVIFANPPYGERLGEDEDLEKLYYQLGETFKQKAKGNTAYVFTGNLPLLKKISLRTTSKDIFFNGAIDSRLAKYELF